MVSRRHLPYFAFALMMSWSVGAYATAEPESPRQLVQRLVNTINSIKPTQQGSLSPTIQEASLAAAREANTILDLRAVGQRSLGKHWQSRTPSEQNEFVALLEQLFAKVAYPKSAEFFSGLEMRLGKENVAGHNATVETTVKHPKEGLVSVDYRLIQESGAWRVQDILLDDVSLVSNLQSQFNKIITEHSYTELVRRIRDKLNE